MTCDEGRPCQRWYGPQLSYYFLIHSCISIKREIGHLCHDERRTKPVDKTPTTRNSPTVVPNTFTPGKPTFVAWLDFSLDSASISRSTARDQCLVNASTSVKLPIPTRNIRKRILGPHVRRFCYIHASLFTNRHRDFLETLDEDTFFASPVTVAPSLVSSTSFSSSGATTTTAPPLSTENNSRTTPRTSVVASVDNGVEKSLTETILPSATKTEKFLLTAADQESGSRDERLNRVIKSKYEAGLLKPYNYVKGYARLSKWMDSQWVSGVFLRICHLYLLVFRRSRNNRFFNPSPSYDQSSGYEAFLERQ